MTAMPTLRPITSHAEIMDYHRFRYTVYANSVQRGFLAGPEGFDIDEFDASALHLGWYEADELVGCVRLLNPIKGEHPLHFFKDLDQPSTRSKAIKLLSDHKGDGRPLCEVSRLCIAPAKRSLSTSRRFVLAIIATAHRYGRDNCLFTCDQPHTAFWKRMGFTVESGFEHYDRPRGGRPGSLMRGSYRDLLARNRVELQRIGFQQMVSVHLAA